MALLDNTVLLGSLLLATGVLSVRLLMQSYALTATDASKKDKLAKNIQGLTCKFIIPLGLAMVIAGCIWWDLLKGTSIVVGSTLIVASITFLVQSKSLTISGDEAVRFGRRVKVWAWVLLGALIVGLGFFVFFVIEMTLIWH
jgi:hypothetical protein